MKNLDKSKKTWFTSDLHFGHNREFMYGPRGFSSIIAHDSWIIMNWNMKVKPNDEVYVLGDLMLGNDDWGMRCLSLLNGNIHIIIGNHDSDGRLEKYDQLLSVVSIEYATAFKYGKNYFYLSHYPTITSNYDDDKPWARRLINLHGHTHSKDKFYNDNPYMYNVSLDAHDNYPVSIDEIIEDIKQKKIERNDK